MCRITYKRLEKLSFTVGRLRIEIYSLWLLQSLYSICFGDFQKYTVMLVSILFHEASHVAVYFLLTGKRAYSVALLPWGAYAKLDLTFTEYGKSLLVLLAGPLSNLFLFGVGTFFSSHLTFFGSLANINLLLALFNLIPVIPLDGGNLLKLASNALGIRCQRAAYCLCLIFSASLILGGILSIFNKSFNPLPLAAGLMLIQNTFFSEGDDLLMNISEIFKKKKRLRKRKAMECRIIAVRDSIRIRDAVRMIGSDDFYIFCLLDEQLHSQSIVTETDMIDAILNSCGVKTAAEVFRKK